MSIGPRLCLALILVASAASPRAQVQQPAPNAALPPPHFVVMFSTDRTHWRVGSRRSRFARPATDGRFVFADVPAGEYLLAALPDLDPTDWQEAASLEQMAGTGIRVTVAEGEQKVQNLRIR